MDFHPNIPHAPMINETLFKNLKIKITKKSIRNISTRNSKCSEFWKKSCEQNRWEQEWYLKQNCQVPFLNFGNHMTSRSDLQLCNRTLLLKGINDFNEFKPKELCPDYSPCHQNKYTFTKEEFDGTVSERSLQSFWVILKYRDINIEINKSYISYALQNFIAEFGGFLGMFLGLSCFSLIESFNQLYNRLSKKH